VQRPTFVIPPGLALGREDAPGAGPRWVVARAEAELVARYGSLDDSERGLTPSMFDPPAGAFVVARNDGRGEPVGGVGVRGLAGRVGEVKRLWVDPAWRDRGIGRALMAALEDTARALGMTALELGTGDLQPEAVALYSATGWERCLTDDDGRPLPDWHRRFTKRLERPATTPAP
jgi:GNAT superfamily N-acetyltransferase